ncbi:unnamed protein product, partial [Meganyctiphanes norvegica]
MAETSEQPPGSRYMHIIYANGARERKLFLSTYMKYKKKPGCWWKMAQKMNEVTKSDKYTSKKCRHRIGSLKDAYQKKLQDGVQVEKKMENAFKGDLYSDLPPAESTSGDEEVETDQVTDYDEDEEERELDPKKWRKKLVLQSYMEDKHISPYHGRWRMMTERMNDITESEDYTPEKIRQWIRNLRYSYLQKRNNGKPVEPELENAFGSEYELEMPQEKLVLRLQDEGLETDQDTDHDEVEELRELDPIKWRKKLVLTTYMEYKDIASKDGRWRIMAQKIKDITESEDCTPEKIRQWIRNLRYSYLKKRNNGKRVEPELENAFGSEYVLNIQPVKFVCMKQHLNIMYDHDYISVDFLQHLGPAKDWQAKDGTAKDSRPPAVALSMKVPSRASTSGYLPDRLGRHVIRKLTLSYLARQSEAKVEGPTIQWADYTADEYDKMKCQTKERMTAKEEIMKQLELWKQEKRDEERKQHQKEMEKMDKLLTLLE